MRRILLAAATLIPIGIFVAIGWHRLRCSDRVYAHYQTHQMAVADGATERGWIPDRVPSSAVEIHEEHDIDTNEVWIRFQVPGQELTKVVGGMRRLDHDEVAALHLRYPCRSEWWYQGVVEQEPANDGALNAEIYVGRSTAQGWPEFVALDRTAPFIYYWSDPTHSAGIAWNGP